MNIHPVTPADAGQRPVERTYREALGTAWPEHVCAWCGFSGDLRPVGGEMVCEDCAPGDAA